MKYRGVIFDLDGTLADTLDDIADSMNRVLISGNFPTHAVPEYKKLIGRGLENLVTSALPARAQNAFLVKDCLDLFIKDYRLNCLVKTKLYTGIPELIHALKARSMKLSIFSNKADDLTGMIVQALFPDSIFEVVAGATKEVPKKPDPTGALLIGEKMGVPPAGILYVGDSDVDMITANRAGMLAVGVAWGFRTTGELVLHGASKILTHPMDLIAMLE